MDTTKEYIAMCDCPEIQKHVYGIGDWFGAFETVEQLGEPFTGPLKLCGIVTDLDLGILGVKNVVWLPRQDQLQDMISNKGRVAHPPFYFVDDLYHFYFNDKQGGYAETMEQLWLAFVMKELYSKAWNGKDWVKTL